MFIKINMFSRVFLMFLMSENEVIWLIYLQYKYDKHNVIFLNLSGVQYVNWNGLFALKYIMLPVQ